LKPASGGLFLLQDTPLHMALTFVKKPYGTPTLSHCKPHLSEVDGFAAVPTQWASTLPTRSTPGGIQEGCTFVTRDVDFARFAPLGLRWRHLVLRT
jgi:hypothetical protein